MPNKYDSLINELETLLNDKNTSDYVNMTDAEVAQLLSVVNKAINAIKPIIDEL